METKIVVNIDGLQALLAKAYAQAGALRNTLDKINAFKLTVSSEFATGRVDSVELARRAGEALGKQKAQPDNAG